MKKLTFGLLLAILAFPTLAADASERKFIKKGMTEGEVLLKIGKPDNESKFIGSGTNFYQKAWSYFPTEKDLQTLTTITFKNGIVIAVERKISR